MDNLETMAAVQWTFFKLFNYTDFVIILIWHEPKCIVRNAVAYDNEITCHNSDFKVSQDIYNLSLKL